jgi:hypothetical protein
MEKYCTKTKSMWRKYCSNLQCFFFKKTIKLNSQQTQYEKKKSTMIILEKKTIIKRKKKIIQGNIIAIHNVFFF